MFRKSRPICGRTEGERIERRKRVGEAILHTRAARRVHRKIVATYGRLERVLRRELEALS